MNSWANCWTNSNGIELLNKKLNRVVVQTRKVPLRDTKKKHEKHWGVKKYDLRGCIFLLFFSQTDFLLISAHA